MVSSLVLLGDSEGTLFTGCVPNRRLRFPPNNLFSRGGYFQSTEVQIQALWELVGIFFLHYFLPHLHLREDVFSFTEGAVGQATCFGLSCSGCCRALVGGL